MTDNNAGDSVFDKVKSFVDDNKDKVEDLLKSDKAEEISDNVLDGLAGAAKKVLGDDHAAKIDEVRSNIDKSIGNE